MTDIICIKKICRDVTYFGPATYEPGSPKVETASATVEECYEFGDNFCGDSVTKLKSKALTILMGIAHKKCENNDISPGFKCESLKILPE